MPNIDQEEAKLVVKLLRGWTSSIPAPAWEIDWDVAERKAKGFKVAIILAAFDAQNCGHCIGLEKNVFESDVFRIWVYSQSLLGRHLILFTENVLDYAHPGPIAQRYQVQGYPTVVGLQSNPVGLSERGRIVGYGSGTTAAQWLHRLEDALRLNQSP